MGEGPTYSNGFFFFCQTVLADPSIHQGESSRQLSHYEALCAQNLKYKRFYNFFEERSRINIFLIISYWGVILFTFGVIFD